MSDHSFSLNKRKHVTLSLGEKYDILKRIDKGEKMADLSKEYNIGRSTIHDLRRNRGKYEAFFESSAKVLKDRKTLKPLSRRFRQIRKKSEFIELPLGEQDHDEETRTSVNSAASSSLENGLSRDFDPIIPEVQIVEAGFRQGEEYNHASENEEEGVEDCLTGLPSETTVFADALNLLPKSPLEPPAEVEIKQENLEDLFYEKDTDDHADVPNPTDEQLHKFSAMAAEHPTDVFFASMAATVKRFPPRLATEARLRVCQLITELESLSIEQQSTSCDQCGYSQNG